MTRDMPGRKVISLKKRDVDDALPSLRGGADRGRERARGSHAR